MGFVAALDIGGTNVKSALVTRDGAELLLQRRATHREEGPEAVVRRILDYADDVVAEGMARFNARPDALGVASLGLVDHNAGTVVVSSNVGWRDLPLRALLAERLKLPVSVVHDVEAGGVAEAAVGAGRGCHDFLFVAVGTGIGGAIMVNGRRYVGAGSAGEIGHIVVRPGGPLCGCGGRGCLEAVASARAIVSAYEELGGVRGTTAAAICLRTATDPLAATAWAEAASALADGLMTYAALMDPDLIIVGGGVSLSGDALFGPVRGAIEERFKLPHKPTVVPAELGDRAGLRGAAISAWEVVDSTPVETLGP